MKVLLTGAAGQLGKELQDTLPDEYNLTAVNRQQCDIGDREAVKHTIQQTAPDLIINAAAYTAVDKAEQEQTQAYAINHLGIENLAITAAETNTKIIHISTDFVFDGKNNLPYPPDNETNPQSIYGASKLAGDKALLKHLPDNHVLIRTSWVYSQYGHNFVKTMLHLMQVKTELGIVADQIGSPTWANGLARCIWAFTEHPQTQGIYHWSDSGIASWYDFAVAIQREGLATGLLKQAIPIKPITTADYPTPAIRPTYSVLDCSKTRKLLGIDGQHWQAALQAMIKGLAAQ